MPATARETQSGLLRGSRRAAAVAGAALILVAAVWILLPPSQATVTVTVPELQLSAGEEATIRLHILAARPTGLTGNEVFVAAPELSVGIALDGDDAISQRLLVCTDICGPRSIRLVSCQGATVDSLTFSVESPARNEFVGESAVDLVEVGPPGPSALC